MKFAAVKKIAAILFSVICIFSLTLNAYAETIQDSLEQRLEDIKNQYNSSDSATQDSISGILEGAGLGDIDLGSLGEGALGSIIGDLGNNLAIDDLFGLVEEAFASGSDMINDVINGGLGTSDGSNTATTKPNAGGSPNIIIANPTPQNSTNAVGVPQLSTKAPTTYDPGSTTAPDIVGAGVTTAGTTAAPVAVDDAMNTSTVAVLVVLSVSTIAVIVAIVIFFVMKKK